MFKGTPNGPPVNVELKYQKKQRTAGNKYKDIELKPKKVLPAKVMRPSSKLKKKRGSSAKPDEKGEKSLNESRLTSPEPANKGEEVADPDAFAKVERPRSVNSRQRRKHRLDTPQRSSVKCPYHPSPDRKSFSPNRTSIRSSPGRNVSQAILHDKNVFRRMSELYQGKHNEFLFKASKCKVKSNADRVYRYYGFDSDWRKDKFLKLS